MPTSVKAFVTPEVLVWARASAGLTLEDAALKIAVTIDQLQAWEQGTDQPTISQLRKLSALYKRPLAVFYLTHAPTPPPPIHDFRKLSGVDDRSESPMLRFEIRRAYERRNIAIELYTELGETPPSNTKEISLADDPERIAIEIRALLGLTYPIQTTWKDPYLALRWIRSAIESLGTLVFQASGIPVFEMRGFSIPEKPLPVITINNKDRPRGRIFSMLHELAHIFLREGGVCTLQETHLRSPNDQRIEIFCNSVAGAVLVPKEYLEIEEIVSNRIPSIEWSNEELSKLGSRYQASRETILRRLLTFRYTSEDFYQQKREEFLREYAEANKKKVSVPIQQHTKALSNAGLSFTRLVLEGYHQDKITATQLSDALGLRMKHIERLQRAIL